MGALACAIKPAAVNTGVITGINPEYGSDAGGHTVTITGHSMAGTPAVSFGGTAATDVVVTSGTTLTCTVPAHVVGEVDVVVESSTLSGVFEYFPAATATYVAEPNLEAQPIGTISGSTAVSPWTNGVFGSGNSIAISTAYALPGRTKSLLSTLAANQGFAGVYSGSFPNSRFALAGGVWLECYCLAEQATLNAAWATGQMKMVKMLDEPGNGATYFSSLLGVELVYNQAAGDFTVAGTGHSGPKSGTLVAGVWTRLNVYSKRLAGNVGRCVVYVDGVKTNDDTLASIGDDTANTKQPAVGGHYMQNSTQALQMWNDGMVVKDGVIV